MIRAGDIVELVIGDGKPVLGKVLSEYNGHINVEWDWTPLNYSNVTRRESVRKYNNPPFQEEQIREGDIVTWAYKVAPSDEVRCVIGKEGWKTPDTALVIKVERPTASVVIYERPTA